MSRSLIAIVFCCVALAGCEKPQLIVNPGEAPAVILDPANQAPLVSAGPDVSVRWPNDSVDLAGSATDDGLPDRSRLQYTWTSATGGITFANPMAPQTAARFPAVGSYVLTLRVSDGALQATDTVTVEVLPAAPPNVAPVVNAGPDISEELPFVAKLQGSASDDGVPSGTLTYQWSGVSGPAAVTFIDGNSPLAQARFSQPGSYELVLTVSDGELSSTDNVIVTMSQAVYPAPDVSETDPDRGWPRVPPADVGMDPALLSQAEAYALEHGGAGIIVHRSRIVHSWGDIDARHELKSTTASIGAIALAFALEENKLQLSDLAATHLPTIGLPPNTNNPQWLDDITIAQLATHTAGFEKEGDYGNLLAAPGTQWLYSDGGLNWLADLLTTVYAQDLREIFIQRVWAVLGISATDDLRWRPASSGQRPAPRPNGIEHREFASGMNGNVNAMARIGLLYLRGGEWAGGQRVFDPSFSDLVRTPRAENANTPAVEGDFPDANHRYGLLWWTNATGALPEVPRDAYWAWGLGDSLIVVIPSLDLVIARVGPEQLRASPTTRVFGDDDWNGDYSVLEGFLNPIVRSMGSRP